MREIRVTTSNRIEALDITADVARAVSGREGRLVNVYTPHTTCGLLVNEHADPSVIEDVIDAVNRMVPADYPYRHREGNSDAHIKSTLIGCSVMIPIVDGSLNLGVWQGIFFVDFDGPRTRSIFVTTL